MARRRLLLVHLFLPDTLEFQDWPDEQSSSHYRVPSQAKGTGGAGSTLEHDAPPSPPPATANERNDLSFEDLDNRLKRASISSNQSRVKQSSSDDVEEYDEALSDSSEPEHVHLVRKASSARPRSNRGSFSDQAKKVNMTSLMSEAASGGIGSRSRRGSEGKPQMPSFTVQSEDSSIPVAPASDHGRSAANSTASPAHTQSGGNGINSAAGNALGLQSRRGSMSAGAGAGTGAGTGRAVATPLDSNRPPQPQKFEGSGTRTPGAHAGGKAGTMTPLSIIGDLKAKRSALPVQQMTTLGDTDRHHPFGSGAVTPLREAPLHHPTGSRTPGPRPALTSSSMSRATMSNLTLTRVNDVPRSFDRNADYRTPLRPLTSAASNAGQAQVSRSHDPLDSIRPNDHGRLSGAQASSHSKHVGRPSLMSRSTTHGPSMAPARHALMDDNESQTPFAEGPKHMSSDKDNQHAAGTPMSVRPPTAASAHYVRSSSKARQSSRQNTAGRRPSSIGARSSLAANRRMSSEASFAFEDFAALPDHHDDQDSPVLLPAYDFVPNPSSNGGLVNAIRSLPEERLRGGKVFIGTPGVTTDEWLGEREQADISLRMRQERECVPVWLSAETFEGAYAHFCKQILWPTFHYTLPTRRGLDYEHEGFACYRHLNERFAEAVVKEYKEGDIIFVNDYHLLLVPEMVREKLPHSKICFFLHIAWPSSEIFRCLSARTYILKGMLGADLVGFQTANFARHFRQTVSRILQLEATPKGIQTAGRGGFVTVGVFPIGIDVASLNERRKEPDVAEWVEKLQSRYEGKKIIVGRDKLDSIKGVRQKLLAFETALNEHPNLLGKVVLLQVALATTEENEEVAAATEVVSRINNKYSTLTYQPVVFLHVQDITFCQYLALLTVADAFLATSLREGMNLTTHEFVICQEKRHKPLILSEFTGTYSSLRACIGINPWNTKQVADAIFKAITMDENEARERWKDLHRQVTTQDAQHWIQSLLGRLERAHIDQQRRNNAFVPRLEIGQSEWRASKSRLILLDLEGTLMADDPLSRHAHGFEPPEDVVRMLLDLTDDSKNRVYIFSGMDAHNLGKLVKRVPRIGLVAENGCSVMYAGSAPVESMSPIAAQKQQQHGSKRAMARKTWTSLVAGTNMSWRESVLEILAYFTERTPGSWLEDRGASILWWFWSGSHDKKEFDWARRQAAEVQNLIYDSLGERFSLRIIPSKSSFLIMPKNTSRASATQHIVSLSHVGLRHSHHHSAATLTPALDVYGTEDDSDDKRSDRESGHDDQTPARSPLALVSPPIFDSTGSSLMDLSAARSFRQPSNAWSMDSLRGSMTTGSTTSFSGGNSAHDVGQGGGHSSRLTYNAHALHPYGLGAFDLVLCIGQDDGLLAYINTLDLPFAPVTCTSAGPDDDDGNQGMVGIGSEANYYADGPQDVMASLREILAFRGRDQKWGVPAMVDV